MPQPRLIEVYDAEDLPMRAYVYENGQRAWCEAVDGSVKLRGIDLSDVNAVEEARRQYRQFFGLSVLDDGGPDEAIVRQFQAKPDETDVDGEDKEAEPDGPETSPKLVSEPTQSDVSPSSEAEHRGEPVDAPSPPKAARKGAPAGGKARKAQPSSKA